MKNTDPSNDFGTTDFERQLLDAWGGEGPSREAHERLLAIGAGGATLAATSGAVAGAKTTALGLPGAGLSASGAATASIAPKAAIALGLGKWLAIAAVGTATLGAAVHVTRARLTSPSVRTTSSTTLPAASALAPSEVTASHGTPAREDVLPTGESAALAARDLPTAVEPAAATTKRSRTRTTLDLGEEVRALDTARGALEESDPAAAIRHLDAYDRVASGALAQEATLVRIEALTKLGRAKEASALARRFLETHPKSTHRDAILRLVGGTL